MPGGTAGKHRLSAGSSSLDVHALSGVAKLQCGEEVWPANIVAASKSQLHLGEDVYID